MKQQENYSKQKGFPLRKAFLYLREFIVYNFSKIFNE